MTRGNLILFLFVVPSCLCIEIQGKLGDPCTLKNERASQSRGICTELTKCPYELSNLRAGIMPTRCLEKGIICCPKDKRISEKKCEKYQEIYKKKELASLLPLEFVEQIESKPKIECNYNKNSLIVGGRNANKGEYPYMVGLGYQDESDPEIYWNCGGTLISEQFVLTAAHCIYTSKGAPTKLLLGDIQLNENSNEPNQNSTILDIQTRKTVNVAEVYKHPNYRPPLFYNDIALVKISQPLKLSRFINPACLPQPGYRFEHELELNAIGWGYNPTQESRSERLQTVRLDRFGNRECDSYFKDAPDRSLRFPQGIIKSQLCAGHRTQHKDTCNGDSGGGLTVNREKPCFYYAVGVTSFGSKNCGNLTPGVYTNVQSYIKWIEDIVWPENSEN